MMNEPFQTTPDADGDRVVVQRRSAVQYSIKVQSSDGEFRMACVTIDDMRRIADYVNRTGGQ